MDGVITVGDLTIEKQEAITDLDNPLPPITALKDTTLVLFIVDMDVRTYAFSRYN